MVVARTLIAVVTPELDILMATVLIDNDVRVDLSKMVSHPFDLFIGEVIIREGYGT